MPKSVSAAQATCRDAGPTGKARWWPGQQPDGVQQAEHVDQAARADEPPKDADIHHSDASREHILDGNGGRQGVGITREEQDLIRSHLYEPDTPDLLDVPVIAEAPRLAYRFSPTGPAGTPDPSRADSLLSAYAAREGAQRLHRAWRDPLDGAPDGATWVYVVRVAEGTDELKTFSGLTAVLWTDLHEKWHRKWSPRMPR